MNKALFREKVKGYDLLDLNSIEDNHSFSEVKIEATDDTKSEIGKRKFRAVALTSEPTSYGTYVDPETSMPKIAKTAGEGKGKPVIINHYSYEETLPYGRTLKGIFESDLERVLIDFYLDDNPDIANAQRAIAGIDSGSVTDVSFQGRGKFVCNFCDEKMGYFGCKNGHYPLMKIMLDADGNETDDPDAMVKTFTILAKFTDADLIELSLAWAGAIPGSEIVKSYSDNQVKAMNHVSEFMEEGIFTASELNTFSRLSNIELSDIDKNKVDKNKSISYNTSDIDNESEKTRNGGSIMSTDLQVQVNEMQATQEQLKTERDTALSEVAEMKKKVESFDTLQANLTAAQDKITALTAEVEELKDLRPKAEQGEQYVIYLRAELKAAKKLQTHVSQEKKNEFYEDVDKMTSVVIMAKLLDEIKDQSNNNKQFIDIIGSDHSNVESPHEDVHIEKQTRKIQRQLA